MLEILGWIAVVCLPLGYWKQVWHIHKHKEVRDLNLGSYILFAVAYLLLGIEAYAIDSMMFLVKNILVIVPTCVIIYQVIVHRDDKWVDDQYIRMAERQADSKVQLMHKQINVRGKNELPCSNGNT